jgi:XTP/dITP diphosphohydrolase
MTVAGDVSQPEHVPPSSLDAFAAAMSSVLEKCVWSQGMTHASLVPYLIEESYELVEAIEAGTVEEIMDELGDGLWQVAFHSEIAARTAGEDFDIQDVAAAVTKKMVRRHPHVFGDETAETPEEVLRLWSAAKAAEKTDRTSALDGIPLGMPALALADKLLGRAERVDVLPTGLGTVRSSTVRSSTAESSADAQGFDEQELGAQLLSIIASARSRGLDAERALRGALRGLRADIREREAQTNQPATVPKASPSR